MKYLVLITCIVMPIYPTVVPLSGENLWRLIDQIGLCFNISASKIDIIDSQVDIWGSSVETVSSTIEATEIVIDDFYSQIESVQETLCDQIITIQNDIQIWASLLEDIDTTILSISDSLIDLISIFDEHLISASDIIISATEELGSVFDSAIDSLTECVDGTLLTQADFDSGTVFITVPGKYTLCENVTSSVAIAIAIQSDNVFLDLNAHTLEHAGTTAIEITNIADIVVTNCFIVSNAASSIIVNNSDHIRIDNIYGINVNCTLSSSNDIVISEYTGIGTGSGISSNFVTDLVIQNTMVGGTTLLGYPTEGILLQSSNFTIQDCIVSGAQTGVHLFDVRNCVMYNVFVNNATSAGVFIDSSEIGFCEFDHVVVDKCHLAMHTLNSQNILIKETSLTTSDLGLFIENTQNTVIKRCSIVNNAASGITIDALSNNTQILDSCVVSNGINIVDNGINTTVIDLGTELEILCSKIESLDAQIITQLEEAASVLDSYLDTALSQIDNLDGTATCVLGVPIVQADLPYTIPGPGVYTVCGPLNHNGSPVITNAFSNVVINFNGYTITTDNRAIECNGPLNNCTIKNGMIRSGLEAIVLSSINGVILENIQIYQPADIGIRATNVNEFTISRCSVQGWNGNTTGVLLPGAFYFDTCTAGLVTECYALGTPSSFPTRGFIVNNPQPNGDIIFEKSVAQNIINDGFLIVGTGSFLNTVLFDSCSAVLATNGFSVSNTVSTFGPSFIRCWAIRCRYGFFGSNITNSLCTDCIALHNSNAGFFVDSSSHTIEITSCISNNNLRGFDLPAFNNTISSSCAIGNSFQGIRLGAGSGNTVIHRSLFGKNGSSGVVDGGALTPAIVDVRSQDPANAITPNPAYILNDAGDSKSSSIVVRTS